jgi:hypothetical protein
VSGASLSWKFGSTRMPKLQNKFRALLASVSRGVGLTNANSMCRS